MKGIRWATASNWLKLGLFAVAIGLTIAAYLPVSAWLDRRMVELKAQVVERLEKTLGRRIQYDSISPSILLYIEIKNLAILKPTVEAPPLVTFADLKIHYSLWSLFSNSQTGNLINEIEIENTNLIFNRQTDGDLFDFFEKFFRSSSTGLETPQINLKGTNLDLTLIDNDRRIQISRLFFSLVDQPSEIQLALHGTLIAVPGQTGNPLGTISSDINFNGVFDRFLRNAHLDLRVSNFKTAVFDLVQQNFQANLINGNWTVRKVQDANPVDIQLGYDQATTELGVSFSSERFVPEAFIKLKALWAGARSWLNSELTAKGEFRLNLTSLAMAYSFQGGVQVHHQSGLPDFALAGELSGDSKHVRFQSIKIVSNDGTLLADGNFDFGDYFPTGKFVIQRLQLPNGTPLSGTFEARKNEQGIQLSSTRLDIGEIYLSNLTGNWNRTSEGGITFSGRTGIKLYDSDRDRSLTWDLHWANLNSPVFALAIKADQIPILASLNQILPSTKVPEAVLHELRGVSLSTDLRFSQTEVGPTIENGKISLSDEDNGAKQVNLTVNLHDKQLQIDDLDLKWGQLHVEGSSAVDFADPSLIKVQNAFVTKTDHFDFTVQWAPWAQTASFKGNFGLNGGVNWTSQGVVSFFVAVQKLPLPLTSDKSYLTLEGGGVVSETSFKLHLTKLALEGDRLGPLKNFTASVSAEVSNQQVEWNNLNYADDISSLTGSGVVEFSPSSINHLSLNLVNSSAKEAYHGEFSQQGEALSGTLAITDSPLARLHLSGLRGKLNLAAQLSGTRDRPLLRFDLAVPDGKLNNTNWNVLLSGRLNQDQVVLEQLKTAFQDQIIQDGTGSLDFKLGKLLLTLPIQGRSGQNSLSSEVALEANLNEALDWSKLQSQISDRLVGRILLRKNQFNQTKLEDFIVNFWQLKGNLSFRGGTANSLLGRLSDNGSFKISLNPPFPVTFDLDGMFDGERIDAKMTKLKADVARIKDLFNIPYLSLVEGQVDGGFSVRGPLADPELAGDLAVFGLKVKTPFVPAVLGPFNTRVNIVGKKITIEKTAGSAGKGRLEVGAEFLLDHLGLDAFQVNVKVLDPVPVYYRLTGIEATGQAQGTLLLTGNTTRAHLDGNFNIQDVGISLDLNSEGKNSSTSDYGLGVDVTLTTGPRVEFFWPKSIAPFNLRAVAAPGQKLVVKVDDRSGNYSILGGIKIRGGEINYLNNSFFLKEGNIAFNENKTKFDPRLTMRAEIRKRDANGPIIIYLKVDDFLSKLTPKFDSSPPKSPDELNSLVGTTLIVPQEYLKNANLNTYLGLATDVTTSFLLKPVVDSLKRAFSLDLLSVKTDVIKQAILNNQKETPISMEDYLDNTGVYLGKYLGDDVFMEVLGNLKANKAQTTSTDGAKTLDFELELGLEFQTPFFLLNWHFVPKNPESLFITDNTVSLSWKLTF